MAMPACLVANIKVTDPPKFTEHCDKVAPMVARFGGRYLVRGGAVQAVEGEPVLDLLAVLEFTDMQALRRFYASPGYVCCLPCGKPRPCRTSRSSWAARRADARRPPHSIWPPSTTMVWPVTQRAAGEARNSTTSATSSGVPSRPKGMPARMPL
jgi:uncharacterized protein (DUF1330 family)